MTSDPDHQQPARAPRLSAERLAEIHRQVRYGYHPGSTEDLLAEVEALRADNASIIELLSIYRRDAAAVIGRLEERATVAEARARSLEAALRIYADPDQWDGFFWPIHEDRGVRARLALAQVFGEDGAVAAGLHAASGGRAFPLAAASTGEAPEASAWREAADQRLAERGVTVILPSTIDEPPVDTRPGDGSES